MCLSHESPIVEVCGEKWTVLLGIEYVVDVLRMDLLFTCFGGDGSVDVIACGCTIYHVSDKVAVFVTSGM